LVLARFIPFIQGMSAPAVFAVALLGATIMVARSPSSAYAIIKELRARGPFTQTVLGVTVLMDAVVIVIFTINASLAHLLVEGIRFNTKLLFIVVFEVILDILLGILIGEMLRAILALRIKEYVKSLLLLLIGYSITHHWQVKLADIETSRIERLVWPEVEAHVVATLTPEALNALEIKKADAIVAMLDDDSNYTLCELRS
jgi:Kef-type K+ transport system membrane component KefB